MRLIAAFILTIISVTGLRQGAYAQSSPWVINVKDPSGSKNMAVGISVVEEKGNRLVALDWLLPWSDVTSVIEVNESGDAVPITVLKKTNGLHAYLVSSSGTLKVARTTGAVSMTYQLQKNSAPLKLDPVCRKAGLKPQMISKEASRFPAVLVCRGPKDAKTPTEILFSSLRDAEWYGTDAFETSGKGERFKTFSFGDTSALKNWKVTWGADAEKNIYGVVFPPRSPPTPPPVPAPSTTYDLGMSYEKGDFTSAKLVSKLSGLSAVAQITYKKPQARWYANGNAQLFVYALEKDPEGSPNVSKASGVLGLEQNLGRLRLRENVGLVYRWVDLPGLAISANFQAPRVGLEAKLGLANLKFEYATTSAGGKYSEMRAAGLIDLSKSKTFHPQVGLSYNKLEAQAADLSAQGSWYSLDLLFGF